MGDTIDHGFEILQLFEKQTTNPSSPDLTLHIHQSSIQVHRLVLALRSPVFFAMLYGNMQESRSPEITINDPLVDAKSFGEFIRYIYCGKLNIGPSNVLSLLYLGKMYQFESMVIECKKALEKMISIDNAVILVDAALIFDEKEIKEKCLAVIDENGEKVLSQKEFDNVSAQTVLEIICRGTLKIDELVLFRKVVNWLKKSEDRNTYTSSMIKWIRFPLIPSQFLVQEVKPTNLVPMEQYLEALEYQASPTIFDTKQERFSLRMPPVLIPPVLEFDPSRCNSKILLSNENKTAARNDTGHWSSVLSLNPISALGKTSWEVLVNRHNDYQHLTIGVAEPTANLMPASFGADEKTWGAYGFRGHGKVHNNNSESYGGNEGIKTGDVIRVTVDMDKGHLSFQINENDKGMAFDGLKGKILYPYVSFYHPGTVTLKGFSCWGS